MSSGSGSSSQAEANAYIEEFNKQMIYEGLRQIDPNANYQQERQMAKAEARRRTLAGQTFKGGKIYRQKRVRKSRRVSNRRRRNKSIRRRKN